MFLQDSVRQVPQATNEPILGYAPGSPERATLEKTVAELSGETWDVPLFVGGQEQRTKKQGIQVSPHRHEHQVARYALAGASETNAACDAAARAWHDWSRTPFEARAAIFLRAAELIAGKYRARINAATMLGQSKTAHQAEIDAACELIDFLRFNVSYAARLYTDQPDSSPAVWNALDLRPLEGFVLAVTPFNFTAIAGNLAAAPALMGNTVVWKPSDSALMSGWVVMEVLREAGLPPGVINFVPGPPEEVVGAAMKRPDLAGVHFTGSTHVFQSLYRRVGEHIASYRSYPRLVGETGGKDFLVAHASADVAALETAVIRGAYEFQGQKCSALSRLYVARSVWDRLEGPLCDKIRTIRMGDVADLSNFMGAVIKEAAFDKHADRIGRAKKDGKAKLLAGGECDKSTGWFVRPTLIEVNDAGHALLEEELFGPILAAYVYPDGDYEDMLARADATSPYALTGAIFANDRAAVNTAHRVLRHAAGNFYINDKPTGAVVGQQPFGGSRASGTNDKAGSPLNLLRWTSPRTIKENLAPPIGYEYPYMR